MRSTASAVALLLLAMAATCSGQASLSGKDHYPQFRVLSGLSGGGYGVLPNGTPDTEGAAALSTPIGYTLDGHAALSFFSTSRNLDPFLYDPVRLGSGRQSNNDGTGNFTIGGSFKGWKGAVSFMVLSTHLDSAFNLQVSPPLPGRLGVSFGVQDIDGGGGAAGTNIAGDLRSSRSYFAAATYDIGHSVYATLGTGDRRFKGAFGNVSAPISPRLRATVEYDSFSFNGGLLYGTGPLRELGGRLGKTEADVFLGIVAGRYGTVGLSFTL